VYTAEATPELGADPRLASRWWVRPTLAEVLAIVGGQILLGVLAGLLWLVTAPTTMSYVLGDTTGATLILPSETENQIAGDGRFAAYTALIGIAAGLFAWYGLRRLRGPSGVALVGLGAVASALTAQFVGELLSTGDVLGPAQSVISPPLQLHANTLLLLPAFGGLLVYTVLAGLSTDDSLGVPATHPATPDARSSGVVAAGSGGAQAGPQSLGADRDGPQQP